MKADPPDIIMTPVEEQQAHFDSMVEHAYTHINCKIKARFYGHDIVHTEYTQTSGSSFFTPDATFINYYTEVPGIGVSSTYYTGNINLGFKRFWKDYVDKRKRPRYRIPNRMQPIDAISMYNYRNFPQGKFLEFRKADCFMRLVERNTSANSTALLPIQVTYYYEDSVYSTSVNVYMRPCMAEHTYYLFDFKQIVYNLVRRAAFDQIESANPWVNHNVFDPWLCGDSKMDNCIKVFFANKDHDVPDVHVQNIKFEMANTITPNKTNKENDMFISFMI